MKYKTKYTGVKQLHKLEAADVSYTVTCELWTLLVLLILTST